MYWCDEQRITGAVDVHEVIAWADRTALPEQTYTLYVEHHLEHGRGAAGLGMIRAGRHGCDPPGDGDHHRRHRLIGGSPRHLGSCGVVTRVTSMARVPATHVTREAA